MATSLLQLMEELLQSIEQRDAGDPDAPAWEASARIEGLEAEITRRLTAGELDEAQADVSAAAGPQARRSDEAVAGVA
jgi:hypothetical protein